jgi:hypothetical protein
VGFGTDFAFNNILLHTIVKMPWERFYPLPRFMWCIVMAIDFSINVSSFPMIRILARSRNSNVLKKTKWF